MGIHRDVAWIRSEQSAVADLLWQERSAKISMSLSNTHFWRQM